MDDQELIKELSCWVAFEAVVIFAFIFVVLFCRSVMKEKDKDIEELKAAKCLETRNVIRLQASERKLEERVHRLEWYVINMLSRAGVGKLDAATYVDRLANGDLEDGKSN